MAEKTIIVDFEINAEDVKAANEAMDDATASAASYQQELNKLKTDQKELNALYKIGAVGANEYAQKQTLLKKQITDASKGVRESNKEFKQNKIIVEAAKGSNDQLRARLSILTKEYNGLSKKQRENTKAGKQRQATIEAISSKLKANEKAVGDNRRNVGNYQQAIEDAAGQLNIMGVNVGGVINSLKSNIATLKAVTASTRAYTAGTNAQTVATEGAAVATGIGTKAMRIFKVALAGTGIGLLIVAVASLISYFTMTKRGVALLDQAFAGIKATIAVVTDRLSGLVDAFIMFKNGDYAKAADKISDSFKGIGSEIANDAKAAAQLEKEMQAVVDAERALSAEKATTRGEIKRLGLISEDVSKDTETRLEAGRKAKEIETALMAKMVDTATERLRITKAQNELGESLAADLDREAEAQKALGDIKVQSIEMQTTLNNRLNVILKSADVVAQKAEVEARKAEAEKREATEEQIELENEAAAKRKEIREEFRLEQLSEIERSKEEAIRKSQELRDAGVEELEIKQFLSDKLLEIDSAERDAELETTLQFFEDEAEAARSKVRVEIESEYARNAAIMLIDQELLEAKQQTLDLEANQYQASIDGLAIIDEERQAKLLLDKAEVDAQLVELDREKTDAVKSHLDEVDEKQKESTDKALGAASGGLGALGGMLSGIGDIMNQNIKDTEEQAKAAGKSDAQIRKQTKAARKEAHQMAVAAAIVQTLQAAISAYSSGAAVPVVGMVLGPVMAASHAEGGIPISVNGQGGYEAEGNEIVLTKGVYNNPSLRSEASRLNVLGGGNPISGGNYFAAGGVLQSTGSIRSASNQGNAAINAEISNLGDRIQDMRTVVSVTDIERVSGQKRKVQAISEL